VSLRFWNSYCRDEGVRAICNFLSTGKPVNLLELLNNKITPLGCEFISKTLHPKMQPQIMILKLDHNNFGSEGMIRLADGLAMNSVLKMLSVTYCNIDAAGAQALFEILIYTKSVLEELNLTGNVLREAGTIKVLNGVSIAKHLKKIYLADNQFSMDSEAVRNVI
jgi:Ran GTPase-activating protein (RanGAP) involved in mRNA processing and transport